MSDFNWIDSVPAENLPAMAANLSINQVGLNTEELRDAIVEALIIKVGNSFQEGVRTRKQLRDREQAKAQQPQNVTPDKSLPTELSTVVVNEQNGANLSSDNTYTPQSESQTITSLGNSLHIDSSQMVSPQNNNSNVIVVTAGVSTSTTTASTMTTSASIGTNQVVSSGNTIVSTPSFSPAARGTPMNPYYFPSQPIYFRPVLTLPPNYSVFSAEAHQLSLVEEDQNASAVQRFTQTPSRPVISLLASNLATQGIPNNIQDELVNTSAIELLQKEWYEAGKANNVEKCKEIEHTLNSMGFTRSQAPSQFSTPYPTLSGAQSTVPGMTQWSNLQGEGLSAECNRLNIDTPRSSKDTKRASRNTVNFTETQGEQGPSSSPQSLERPRIINIEQITIPNINRQTNQILTDTRQETTINTSKKSKKDKNKNKNGRSHGSIDDATAGPSNMIVHEQYTTDVDISVINVNDDLHEDSTRYMGTNFTKTKQDAQTMTSGTPDDDPDSSDNSSSEEDSTSSSDEEITPCPSNTKPTNIQGNSQSSPEGRIYNSSMNASKTQQSTVRFPVDTLKLSAQSRHLGGGPGQGPGGGPNRDPNGDPGKDPHRGDPPNPPQSGNLQSSRKKKNSKRREQEDNLYYSKGLKGCVDPFSGEKEKVLDFVSAVESFRWLAKINDETLVAIISCVLTGPVSNWYRQNMFEFKSWQDLVKKLLRDFIDRDYSRALGHQARARKQQPGEKFSYFATSIRTLVGYMDKPFHEKKVMKLIIQNSLPEILTRFAGYDFKDYAEMEKLVGKFESMIKLAKKPNSQEGILLKSAEPVDLKKSKDSSKTIAFNAIETPKSQSTSSSGSQSSSASAGSTKKSSNKSKGKGKAKASVEVAAVQTSTTPLQSQTSQPNPVGPAPSFNNLNQNQPNNTNRKQNRGNGNNPPQQWQNSYQNPQWVSTGPPPQWQNQAPQPQWQNPGPPQWQNSNQPQSWQSQANFNPNPPRQWQNSNFQQRPWQNGNQSRQFQNSNYRRPQQCLNCGQNGHSHLTCRAPHVDFCFICGRYGVTNNTCPCNTQPQAQRNNQSTGQEPSTSGNGSAGQQDR